MTRDEFLDELLDRSQEIGFLEALNERGYAIVPVEPTDKAQSDAIQIYEEMTGGARLPDGNGYDQEIVSAIYKAMIEVGRVK